MPLSKAAVAATAEVTVICASVAKETKQLL